MVSKKMKVRIQKSRKVKNSRKDKKSRKTSRVTFKKGGGIWDSIKNVFSNKDDVPIVEPVLPQEQNVYQNEPQPEPQSSNIDISPINSGGCIQRKRMKLKKRA